ncbi:hypothetical protein QWY15_04240 [Planococcus sp. N064]|uniref:Uncharacterized protein n=1 Tax=Planococcus liqunii TaxID=3058394 RepID=A0ABT8MP12_9BACL|nr:hypothetical protein [Planococcus sp. N064]MDN7226499.1 hypothetical protein [Planococcus sp. N064]
MQRINTGTIQYAATSGLKNIVMSLAVCLLVPAAEPNGKCLDERNIDLEQEKPIEFRQPVNGDIGFAFIRF